MPGVEPRPSVNDWSFARTKSRKQLGMPKNWIPMTQSAKALLGDLENCWDLDVLQLHEVTGGRPLFALFWAVVHKHGLLDHEMLPADVFQVCYENRDGYLDNPYHNSTHAADVLNGCHHFVQQLGFKDILTTWQTYSLLFLLQFMTLSTRGCPTRF